jgi:peptidyl-tRNA hydrolase, PTH1 family
VLLVKPQTFMNLSGTALQAYGTRLGLKADEVLVVHDDLDLPLGRLRFKTGGGAGGQRGVADIVAKLGAGFHRLKIGIDRPPPAWQAERWVLSKFREDETALLNQVVEAAADALELALVEGLGVAMNRYNGVNLAVQEESP